MTFLYIINRPIFNYCIIFLCFFCDILLANVLGHQFFYCSTCAFITFLLDRANLSTLLFSAFTLITTAFIHIENSAFVAILAIIMVTLAHNMRRHIDSKFIIGYSLLCFYLITMLCMKIFWLQEKIQLGYIFLEFFGNIGVIALLLSYLVRHELGNRFYYQ